MNNFEELYQEIIMEHYRSPHGSAALGPECLAKVHENPTCGDSIKLVVEIDGADKADNGSNTGNALTIANIRYEISGCAISTASASIMHQQLCGSTVAQACEYARGFIAALRGESPPELLDNMGDLVVFRGVRNFPVRVKCATLAWHALLDELEKASAH